MILGTTDVDFTHATSIGEIANNNANDAINDAIDAKNNAQNAQDKADAAKEIADAAKAAGEAAQKVADNAAQIGEEAKNTANDAKTAADGVSQTAKDAETAANAAQAAADNALSTANGLKTEVDGKADFTTVTQIDNAWKLAVKGLASEADITAAIDNIQLSVKNANGSESIFNISDNTIILDSSKIILDGSVSIEDGTINNAKIGNLSADKITGGTIDGNVINVKNINASNITGGTIDGNVINVSNINADQINSGTLSSVAVQTSDSGSVTEGNGATYDYIELAYLDKNGVHEYYVLRNGTNTLHSMSTWLKDGSVIFTNGGATPNYNVENITSLFHLNYTGANLPPTTIKDNLWVNGTIEANDNILIGASPHVINSEDAGDLYFQSGSGSGNVSVNIHAGDIYTNNTSGMRFQGTGDSNTINQLGNKDIYFRGATSKNNISIHATALVSTSRMSTKQNIKKVNPEHANDLLLAADIASWNYINADNQIDRNVGVVIDDVSEPENKKYGLPNELIRSDGDGPADVMSLVGYLIAQNQYQAKQIEELNLRLRKEELTHE